MNLNNDYSTLNSALKIFIQKSLPIMLRRFCNYLFIQILRIKNLINIMKNLDFNCHSVLEINFECIFEIEKKMGSEYPNFS